MAPRKEPLDVTIHLEAWNEPSRTYQGSETAEIQTLIDHELQSGTISAAHTISGDGTISTQYLPSCCQGGWPVCLSCRCGQI